MTRCHATPAFSRLLRATALMGTLCATVQGASALESLQFTAQNAPDALADRLRGASLLLAAEREARTTPEDILSAARAEYRTLTGVLYGAGHYSGTVSVRVNGREASGISPLSPPGRIGPVEIRVDPGPAFVFGTAEVTPRAPDTDLPAGFAPSQPAAAGLISDAASAAVSGWRDAGHPKARLAAQRVTADHRAQELDAKLRVDPGPQLRFAAPTVAGNTRVRTRRVTAIAGLPEGEVFSPQALETSAARLRRAGAFRSVSLEEGDAANGTLPVEIIVVEAPRRRLGFGAELSSLDGLTLSGFWLHRNLLGGSERFRFDGEIAQIGGENSAGDATADVELSVRYERPATFTPDTDLYLGASVHRIDEPNYLSSGVVLGGGLTHIFSDRLTGAAGVAISRTQTEDSRGTRDFTLLSFPVEATFDTRDVALDATTGFYADVTLMPFLAIEGTDDGIALEVDTRAYHGFGADNGVVLAGRFQMGVLAGPSLTNAPADMLFFAGGGGSVRGHSYQSLGIPDGAGNTTGGLSLLALSTELRVKVTDSIGVVAFADTGFVGADSTPGQNGDWITGAGIGARYQTPIGPLRLDIATPVSGGTDSGVQLYIGIGQAF